MTGLPRPSLSRDGLLLRSTEFGDLYHSAEDGLAEARHVFLEGNDLPARFARLDPGRSFTVAELGLGTGLNLMATMAAFEAHARQGARLHLWTLEGFPLSRPDLVQQAGRIVDRWPELAAAAQTLAAAYPEPLPGQRQLRLSPRITLTCAFGPAAVALGEASLRADAWFLDGFAPARNPDMWSPELLSLVAMRSAPSASLATFTVAGSVRRGLAEAGFAPRKVPGYGRKREMTVASLAAPSAGEAAQPAGNTPEGPIAVLGAGIAGASLAWHLRRAGRRVRVFDPGGIGAGASGNPIGLLTPRFEAQDGPIARFYRDAFLYALDFYREAAPELVEPTGAVIRIAPRRLEKVLALGIWPADSFALRTDGVAVGDAATLRVRETLRALLEADPVSPAGTPVWTAGGWRLGEGEESYAAVVVAAAMVSAELAPLTDAPLTASLGQIDRFAVPPPETVLSGDGYVAPFGSDVFAGATYDALPAGQPAVASRASSQANRTTAKRLLGRDPGPSVAARASVRAATRDRHPLAGEVSAPADAARGLYVVTGLGSRGLTTAPILAAHVTALIQGTPSPLTRPQINALHPSRFSRRAARRAAS